MTDKPIIPLYIQMWCSDNGWIDPFVVEGKVFAFPPGAAMAIEVPLLEAFRYVQHQETDAAESVSPPEVHWTAEEINSAIDRITRQGVTTSQAVTALSNGQRSHESTKVRREADWRDAIAAYKERVIRILFGPWG